MRVYVTVAVWLVSLSVAVILNDVLDCGVVPLRTPVVERVRPAEGVAGVHVWFPLPDPPVAVN